MKSLTELMEDVSVWEPYQWENESGPKGWFAVCTEREGGIIAYFKNRDDAYRFRVDHIKRILCP